MKPRSVTLIITTYNWPEALKRVIDSALNQSRLPEQIIIADDGSRIDTKNIIIKYQQKYAQKVEILHAWQEDKGFRLARSRNNALRLTTSEYVIFVDGDTILHRDFIVDHLNFSQKNVFVVGSRILLTEEESQDFLLKKNHFTVYQLLLRRHFKALRIPLITRFICRMVYNQPVDRLIFKVRGCNMAMWLSDCVAVNGFNQDMEGWGREDSEFVARLLKKGVFLRRIKFCAIQYHLFHHENTRSSLSKNDDILSQTLRNGIIYCNNGLNNR